MKKKKKRILILGATGMLGSSIFAALNNKYELALTYRTKENLNKLIAHNNKFKSKAFKLNIDEAYLQFLEDRGYIFLNNFFKKIGEIDAVINCLGVIKPYVRKNQKITMFLNSIFPKIVGDFYKEKLIHVSTDCVFSGKKGKYTEDSIPDPNDLYGISKYVGEPSGSSLVIRTSLIGSETHGFVSLVSWIKKQKSTVNGYVDYLWNGITTNEFANICTQIIENRAKFPKSGVMHIYSTDISKYELLLLLKEKYNLSVTINPVKVGKIDRRLRSNKNFNSLLKIPTIEDMINNL